MASAPVKFAFPFHSRFPTLELRSGAVFGQGATEKQRAFVVHEPNVRHRGANNDLVVQLPRFWLPSLFS